MRGTGTQHAEACKLINKNADSAGERNTESIDRDTRYDSVKPLLLILNLHGNVFFGEIGEVLGDHGFDFHFEAIG